MMIFAPFPRAVATFLLSISLSAAALAQQPPRSQPDRQRLAEDNWLSRMFQSSPATPAPAAGGPTRQRSGQACGSASRWMTAAATRAAAAAFGNCVAGMAPLAERRGVSREAYAQL